MILGFYRLKKAHSRPEICFVKDLYKNFKKTFKLSGPEKVILIRFYSLITNKRTILGRSSIYMIIYVEHNDVGIIGTISLPRN